VLRRLRRHPVARWVLAVVVAAVTASSVHRVAAAADAERQRWGEAVAVVVAGHDLAPGDVVSADDVVAATWPAAMVPAGATASTADAVGRTVGAAVVAGEVVLDVRLAPPGVTGAAALLPPGSRGIAVPAGPGTPTLAVGDHVDVLATVDVLDVTEGDAGLAVPEPTVRVATAVPVVAVADDGTATVGVPEPDATRVAFVTARGTVTLALVGTP
jgi:Flp pilus assembly protein CpaB